MPTICRWRYREDCGEDVRRVRLRLAGSGLRDGKAVRAEWKVCCSAVGAFCLFTLCHHQADTRGNRVFRFAKNFIQTYVHECNFFKHTVVQYISWITLRILALYVNLYKKTECSGAPKRGRGGFKTPVFTPSIYDVITSNIICIAFPIKLSKQQRESASRQAEVDHCDL